MTVNNEQRTADNGLLFELLDYTERHTARFHMPGHKGCLQPPFDAVSAIDLTELPGTGDLYHGTDGAIRHSERAMAKLYGARDCFYLTGGATQGIYAMLSAAARPGDAVHVARGCHRSVYNALALLDLRPIWFWDTPPKGAEEPVVYTSPDYYGNIYPRPNTKGIVLCDAAHGAHLPFCLDGYTPPGNLWTVSAHKTLGALGQAAMLLSDGTADAELLRERTALFGTSSPSYVLLASLDSARAELEESGREMWVKVKGFTDSLRKKDARVLQTGDPAKLVIATGDGRGDAARLEREFGVVCEMAGRERIVFMLSPYNTEEDFARLENALSKIPRRNTASQLPVVREQFPKAVMTPREAFFAPRERIALRDAAGRVAACVFAPNPPGVPVFAPGEKIKNPGIFFEMCYTGEEELFVVRQKGANARYTPYGSNLSKASVNSPIFFS
jgi:arginine/lysine/ornithine decarboxylase